MGCFLLLLLQQPQKFSLLPWPEIPSPYRVNFVGTGEPQEALVDDGPGPPRGPGPSRMRRGQLDGSMRGCANGVGVGVDFESAGGPLPSGYFVYGPLSKASRSKRKHNSRSPWGSTPK